MAQRKRTAESDLRDILIDTAEVQLATINAGIEFWGAWLEQATEFSRIAGEGLDAIRENPDDSADVLGTMVDTSRENIRALSDLPRRAAERFIRDLDQAKSKRKKKGTSSGPTREKARSARVKP
jgi:hypothetical protein